MRCPLQGDCYARESLVVGDDDVGRVLQPLQQVGGTSDLLHWWSVLSGNRTARLLCQLRRSGGPVHCLRSEYHSALRQAPGLPASPGDGAPLRGPLLGCHGDILATHVDPPQGERVPDGNRLRVQSPHPTPVRQSFVLRRAGVTFICINTLYFLLPSCSNFFSYSQAFSIYSFFPLSVSITPELPKPMFQSGSNFHG